MISTVTIFVLSNLVAAPPASPWDPKLTSSMEAEARQMFKDLDSGNVAAVSGKMAPDAVVFDIDPENKPVSVRGAAVKKYLDDMGASMKTEGMTMKSTVKTLDCHAGNGVGFCAMEFEQTFTMKGQAPMTAKFRGTLAAHKVGDGWVWDHWHGSFAEVPAAPPPPPAKK